MVHLNQKKCGELTENENAALNFVAKYICEKKLKIYRQY